MDAIANAMYMHMSQQGGVEANLEDWANMADDEMEDWSLDEDDNEVSSNLTDFGERSDAPRKKDETDEERQLRNLEGWTSSVPYACETREEMQEQLEIIVSKLLIAAESRHWEHVVAWNSSLST